MQAFFLEEFCIVLLPAHPGAPSRGVLIGGAGAAPADGLASHLREPRGTARPYNEGSPCLVVRPRTNAGESLRDQEAERSVRVVVGAVPAAKIAAVERREASVSRKTRAAPRKRGIVDAPVGAPLPWI